MIEREAAHFFVLPYWRGSEKEQILIFFCEGKMSEVNGIKQALDKKKKSCRFCN